MGLLGAATTMVDLMMVYVLPQKEEYEGAKNEEVKVMVDGTLHKAGSGADDSGRPINENLNSSLLENSK